MTNNKGRIALIISASIALGLPLGIFSGAALAASTAPHTQSYSVSAEVTPAPVQLDEFTAEAAPEAAYLPPCAEEDSDDCIWDASARGNGEGMSFIAYHGQVYYWEPASGN